MPVIHTCTISCVGGIVEGLGTGTVNPADISNPLKAIPTGNGIARLLYFYREMVQWDGSNRAALLADANSWLGQLKTLSRFSH